MWKVQWQLGGHTLGVCTCRGQLGFRGSRGQQTFEEVEAMGRLPVADGESHWKGPGRDEWPGMFGVAGGAD